MHIHLFNNTRCKSYQVKVFFSVYKRLLLLTQTRVIVVKTEEVVNKSQNHFACFKMLLKVLRFSLKTISCSHNDILPKVETFHRAYI